MNGPDQTQLKRLQATLEQRRSALLSQLASDAATTQAADAREIEASPADNASVHTLHELVAEAAEQKSAQLRLVRHALAKFEDGSYGICEGCGDWIGLSRLNARPEANFCIACQLAREKAGHAGRSH